MKSTFALVRVLEHSSGDKIRWPYRIIETFQTSDGMRTRICDGMWEENQLPQARVQFALKIQQAVK